MSTLFPVGHVLKGRIGQYVISKQLQETVWLAKLVLPLRAPRTLARGLDMYLILTSTNDRNHVQQLVIVKSVLNHPRVANERDVLARFTGQSPYVRPMVDEIVEPAEPVTIVLRHLDSTLLRASIEKTLTRKELKYVSRRILDVLRVMHSEGFVHADIKPDNVMVNYGSNKTDNRFTDVQLADFGGSLPEDHEHARKGTPIGAAIWRSPESLFGMSWDVKTDIWSFGTLVNKFSLIVPALINANQISRLDSSSASSTGPTSTFSVHQA
jgi:serine/threonine protein kinase